jgi:hypothetical protein
MVNARWSSLHSGSPPLAVIHAGPVSRWHVRANRSGHQPLLTAIGSALFLAEVLTPLQALGGGIMLAALVMFQLRR